MTASQSNDAQYTPPVSCWYDHLIELPFFHGSIDQITLSKKARSRWDQLAAGARVSDPLSCGSAWQQAALRHSRRSRDPVIFCQSDTSQVSFSVMATPRGLLLVPLERHWKFGCPLLGPQAVELLCSVLTDVRRLIGDRLLQFEVPGIFPGDPLLPEIQSQFKAIGHQRQDSHAAALIDNDINAWNSRRSPGYRRFLKRALRTASDEGIRMERLTPASYHKAWNAFNRMLAVEKKSWKGRGSTGLFDLPAFCQDLLCQYAEAGNAMVIFATRNGEDVGFCFGGYSDGVYRGQQTSYSEQVRNFSVGHLMHYETARWLCERKARLHHFGPIQPKMNYKRRLCELELQSDVWRFSA